MSSGGMDWAYRMVAAHNLDPLGVAIVLHLGWRDHPDQRTDSGIARALGQHRFSIQKATAKLAALGVLVRRSGQWVSGETVAIVEQAPGARRPASSSADRRAPEGAAAPLPTELAGPCQLSGQATANSVGTKRKENKEKGRATVAPPPSGSPPPPVRPSRSASGAVSTGRRLGPQEAAARAASLSPFQLERLRCGQSFALDLGEGMALVEPGSPLALALSSAVRARLA